MFQSRVVLFLVLWMLCLSSHAATHIRLVVPEFKPYTYQQDGQILGLGVERVLAVLDSLEVSYSLSIVPNYARALAEISKDRADGFFLASENDERNAVAQFSRPIMINRWTWFLNDASFGPTTPFFKSKARIATILNTNTHKWLEKSGFRVTYTASDPLQLVELLRVKRVDAVFVAETVFEESMERLGVDAFPKFLESERDFGAYFSKSFLDRNPNFLERFNAEVRIDEASSGQHTQEEKNNRLTKYEIDN